MLRKRFDNDGKFYVGHVATVPQSSRKDRRRVLCFATRKGVVGASSNFSRSEAYFNAMKAERGLLPIPSGSNPSMLVTSLLRTRGFPVHTGEDCVDDLTAEFVTKEFSKR